MAKIPGIQVPEEPSLPYRLYWSGMEHHATAVGYVCFTYASLESTINRLIQFLLGSADDIRRVIVDASGNSIENRCNLALKLAACPSSEHLAQLAA
jgi:hypothetical protein